MNAPVSDLSRFDVLPRFASSLKAIESLKPTEPLYLVHPEKFAIAAKVTCANRGLAIKVGNIAIHFAPLTCQQIDDIDPLGFSFEQGCLRT